MEAYVNGIGTPEPSTRPFCEEILEKVREHSLEQSDRPAFIDAIDPSKQLTFGQFYQYCNSISAFLQQKHFQKGDIVCVVQPNSWTYAAIFLGVSQLGGILSGVNPSYTKFELKRHFDDCQPKIVFASGKLVNLILEVGKEIRSIKHVISMGKCENQQNQLPIFDFQEVLNTNPNLIRPPPPINIDKDIAVLPYSSGTTGLPKGVKLSHNNLTSLLHAYTWYGKNLLYPHLDSNFDPKQECMLHFLPQHHMFGFSMLLIGLNHGFTGILMEHYQPELLLQSLQKYRIKHLHVVPPIALFLAKSPLVTSYDLSSLRSIYCGAAPIGQQLAKEVKDRLNLKSVTAGYGLTESTLSFFRPTYFDDPPMSSGKLQGCMEAKLNIETKQTVRPNQIGELCVRGNLVMLGYLNNDRATQEVLDADGWLRTGDIGKICSNGYLFIVDRLKELIKVNGRQVAPAELEDILQSYPKISDASVIGIPDEKHGEVPLAFVVKKDVSLNEREIHDMLKEKVSAYKQLKGGIQFVDIIPKSPSGKILRRKLRELHTNKAKL